MPGRRGRRSRRERCRPVARHKMAIDSTVPIRVVIFQTSTGEVRLAYDLPSSLMSRLRNEDASAAAHELDAKLRALGELATGAVA